MTLAFALREPWPHVIPVLVLLAWGATGDGLSLRFYLLAQRRIGTARTASIFSLAPFVGAVLEWALGDRVAAGLTTVALRCLVPASFCTSLINIAAAHPTNQR